jgi:hypothetical protein
MPPNDNIIDNLAVQVGQTVQLLEDAQLTNIQPMSYPLSNTSGGPFIGLDGGYLSSTPFTAGYQNSQWLAPAVTITVPMHVRRFGCPRCKEEREPPVTGIRAPSTPGIEASADKTHGYCGQCGSALMELRCMCCEPLHDKEPRCRGCGRDNTARLLFWKLHEDTPSPEELESRGNTPEEGETFRGVREP